MSPHRPRHHDTAPTADDHSSTDAPTTDCSATNPVDDRLDELLGRVSRWHALLVGALTVVLAHEIVAVLPLGDAATTLAVFPVTLALLYVLLAVAAGLEGR